MKKTGSVLAALLVAGATAADTAVESIDGLAAWYKIGTTQGRALRDGETVRIWRDSSSNGHDLVSDDNGVRAVYRVRALNDRSVVVIGKGNTHSVTAPLELGDHTIFLVYAAGREERALFQSTEEGEDHYGIVLRGKGDRDLYKDGQRSLAYNAAVPLGGALNVIVLGRESGRLRSFINGVDVSSNGEFTKPIRVGRFFRLSLTRFVKLDGEGLSIAEMIFFDRYLTDEERDGVIRYLAEKYAVDLWETAEAVRRLGPDVALAAWAGLLSTDSEQNVNAPKPMKIAWTMPKKLEAPLVHDPAENPTRVHCSRDNTRVRVFVSLPMTTSVAGADVRVLVLKNNSEYQDDEASTDPMPDAGDSETVEFETELVLNNGDFIEIVTMAEGEPGRVVLEPDQAVLGIVPLNR